MTDRELTAALSAYTEPDPRQVEELRARVLDAVSRETPKVIPLRRRLRALTGVAAALLALVIFGLTPPGAAALEYVKEQAVQLIDLLFPPKDIPLSFEGNVEEIPHTAVGKDPQPAPSQSAQPSGDPHPTETPTAIPGFALYVDTDRYDTIEENGATYIRYIPVLPTREEVYQNNFALLEGLSGEELEAELDRLMAQQAEFYTSLPPCEIEIRHLPGTLPAEDAAAIRESLLGQRECVSDLWDWESHGGLGLDAYAGLNWDSPQEHYYFVEDGQGGTFRLTVRYFLEAAEGHGVRLRAMAETFAVIPPQ